jgi:hypothetical protein
LTISKNKYLCLSVDNAGSEVLRLSRKGKQYGKIDSILRIHLWGYSKNSDFTVILIIITNHKLSFVMLFMQLRGKDDATTRLESEPEQEYPDNPIDPVQ